MNVQEGLSVNETRRSRHKESPLGLFIAVIRDHPKATEREHRELFRKLVTSDGYEDFLNQLIAEWEGLKYSSALRAAQPPTMADIKARADQRKAEAEKADSVKAKAKEIIGSRILDLVTPNGKTLRSCTGTECIKLGGFYAKVGEKVGPTKKVGQVLGSVDIATLWG